MQLAVTEQNYAAGYKCFKARFGMAWSENIKRGNLKILSAIQKLKMSLISIICSPPQKGYGGYI